MGFDDFFIELSTRPDKYIGDEKVWDMSEEALKNVLELKSKYAFRLYELLKQYQSIGRRKFSVSELRDLLGVEQGELKLWVHFKTRVLEIAKREINAKTDLVIDYTTKKVGRRIEFIIFSIRAQSREQKNKQSERYDELIKLVPEKYRELKTLKSAIVKYFKKKGFEYVKRNIEYANLKAEKNYRAYLINALKEDWAADWQDDQKVQQIEVQESVKAELKAKKKLEQKHELHELQIQKNKEKLRELRAKTGFIKKTKKARETCPLPGQVNNRNFLHRRYFIDRYTYPEYPTCHDRAPGRFPRSCKHARSFVSNCLQLLLLQRL